VAFRIAKAEYVTDALGRPDDCAVDQTNDEQRVAYCVLREARCAICNLESAIDEGPTLNAEENEGRKTKDKRPTTTDQRPTINNIGHLVTLSPQP
jgi:hypothetical protein